MTGKAILQWYNESSDKTEQVCECFFNKKGILCRTGEVFRVDLLPVICKNSVNLTRSLSDWLHIRDRWKQRPDCKLTDIANNTELTKKNNYASPFDNYSFLGETDDFTSDGSLNYPLAKECYIDGICIYSREVNKDSLLYRLCLQAELSHVFEPGTYEIVTINGDDSLCWKTRMDRKYEYIPFIEYVKPFFSPVVSKAMSVVQCCKYYQIPGWQEMFFELCSIDGIVEIEKDLDSLFVLRDKSNIRNIHALSIL